MEIITLDALNLDEAHFLLVRKIFQSGSIYEIEKGSYEGHKRLEFDFVTIRIKKPHLRPLSPQLPQGIPPMTDDDAILEYFTNYLMREELQPNEIYTYGNYIAPQLHGTIQILKDGGRGTNQATISIGGIESISQEHPPCLRLIDNRIKDGKLHQFLTFRSWDLWAALPENLGGLQILKEYMALEIGVEPGETIATSKGMHLYDYQWPIALSRLNGVLPENSIISKEDVELGERWK